ncbi:hypothetical protein COO60DRAFT_1635816 [Scenedesmus sp. NREL 46B-D3]|nr:hypothetical protein COO60DRAFT_1635816 [Scenedesmus sp. NREL 46B-D3]
MTVAQVQTEAAHHSAPSDMGASHINSRSSTAVMVTAEENFAAACTLLGGFDTSCFRGYVGTWTSFGMQHNDCCNASSAAVDTTDPTAATAAAAAAAAAAATESTAATAAARVSPVFEDELVNFRLFKMEDPAAMKYQQVNMYQGGGQPAASSYKAYLSSDVAAAAQTATACAKDAAGLGRGRCGLTLVNGALPGGTDQQHSPGSWWMEAIFKQPGSHARRWGMLHRFDAGRLANSKSMNEDLTEVATDQLPSCFIDPAGIAWQPRQQGAGQQQQQQQQRQPVVVQIDLPDWSYSRVPADFTELTAAAAAAAVAPAQE